MKDFTCPLTGLSLVKRCPVTTCIWNTKNPGVETGCFHLENPSNEYLARAHKVDLEALEIEQKKAVKQIQNLVLLDGYSNWLDTETVNNTEERYNPKLESLLSKYPLTVPGMRWNVEKLTRALDEKIYNKFISSTGLIKEIPLYELFWLTKKEYTELK